MLGPTNRKLRACLLEWTGGLFVCSVSGTGLRAAAGTVSKPVMFLLPGTSHSSSEWPTQNTKTAARDTCREHAGAVVGTAGGEVPSGGTGVEEKAVSRNEKGIQGSALQGKLTESINGTSRNECSFTNVTGVSRNSRTQRPYSHQLLPWDCYHTLNGCFLHSRLGWWWTC